MPGARGYRDYSKESTHARTIFIHELRCIKKTNEWAKRTSGFFDALLKMNKSRSSTFYGMMFLFHPYWDFFTFQFKDWKRTTLKICRSSNQTRTIIVLHSVNHSMYEIQFCSRMYWNNSIFSCHKLFFLMLIVHPGRWTWKFQKLQNMGTNWPV